MVNFLKHAGGRTTALFLALLLLLGILAGCDESDISDTGTGTSNDSGAGVVSGSGESEGEGEEKNIAERVDFSDVAANAADDFEYKVHKAPISGAEGISIAGYTGDSDVVVVPDTIDGHPVMWVDLAGTVDAPREDIKAIKLPDGVRVVHLDYCQNLTTVELATEISYSESFFTFTHCPDLIYINVPNGVTCIGASYFNVSNCRSLISLELPDSVEQLEGAAFENCTSLESINLPDTITRITQKAFYSCSSLKSINIPQSCGRIERLAFQGCRSLESVTIPANVCSIEQRAFEFCGLKTIVIEDGDANLTFGSGCFKYCYNLTYVEIPDRVKSIADETPFSKDESFELVIKCSAESIMVEIANANGYTLQLD